MLLLGSVSTAFSMSEAVCDCSIYTESIQTYFERASELNNQIAQLQKGIEGHIQNAQHIEEIFQSNADYETAKRRIEELPGEITFNLVQSVYYKSTIGKARWFRHQIADLLYKAQEAEAKKSALEMERSIVDHKLRQASYFLHQCTQRCEIAAPSGSGQIAPVLSCDEQQAQYRQLTAEIRHLNCAQRETERNLQSFNRAALEKQFQMLDDDLQAAENQYREAVDVYHIVIRRTLEQRFHWRTPRNTPAAYNRIDFEPYGLTMWFIFSTVDEAHDFVQLLRDKQEDLKVYQAKINYAKELFRKKRKQKLEVMAQLQKAFEQESLLATHNQHCLQKRELLHARKQNMQETAGECLALETRVANFKHELLELAVHNTHYEHQVAVLPEAFSKNIEAFQKSLEAEQQSYQEQGLRRYVSCSTYTLQRNRNYFDGLKQRLTEMVPSTKTQHQKTLEQAQTLFAGTGALGTDLPILEGEMWKLREQSTALKNGLRSLQDTWKLLQDNYNQCLRNYHFARSSD